MRLNNLTTFNTDIFHIPYLEELVLSRNDLQSVDISSYSRLQFMHLSYNNKLSNITYKKLRKPPLIELILSGGQIDCTHQTWVEFFFDFPHIKKKIDEKYEACIKKPDIRLETVSTIPLTNRDYTERSDLFIATPITNMSGLSHAEGSDSANSNNVSKCK